MLKKYFSIQAVKNLSQNIVFRISNFTPVCTELHNYACKVTIDEGSPIIVFEIVIIFTKQLLLEKMVSYMF